MKDKQVLVCSFSPVLYLSLTVLSCLLTVVGSSVSCYSDSGKTVDWFIVYKLPKRSRPTGLRYMYLDSTTDGWRQGSHLINDSRGAVGRTLTQLYKQGRAQDPELAYVLYNDQSGKHSESDYGHTKGVVLFDQRQGFWLVHSTPHFPPPANASYSWPDSGKRNGQSFLCVTYPYAQFNQIGLQLLYNDPHVYSQSLPVAFADDLPNLRKVLDIPMPVPPGDRSLVVLPSVAGTKFSSFAKSKAFGEDLYGAWLAGQFAGDLLVQSWPNSRGTLPSNCSGTHHVYNVQTVGLPGSPAFASTVDHSKWCLTRAGGGGGDGGNWVCVGDVNRNRAEEFRGGGTVCLNHPGVWKSFSSLVVAFHDCNAADERLILSTTVEPLGLGG